MTDIFLRASSKRALRKLFAQQGWINEEDRRADGANIDVIEAGEFVVKPSEYDQDGNQTAAPVVDDAHAYANVRLVGPALEQDRIERVLARRAESLEANEEDVRDRSKAARWLEQNGAEQDRVSLYPGGPTRRRSVASLGGGDEVELVWPAPQFPRRMWL